MAPRTREQLIKIFHQALDDLELFPLEKDEDLNKFRVNYDEGTLNDLEDFVTYGSAKKKIIFSGHTGCGKSTLLAALERRCQSSRFVVRFSIADTIEDADVNHINILFAIALKLMEEAENQNIELPENIKQGILDWFTQRAKIKQLNVGAGASMDTDIIPLVALRLKVDAAIREEIKQEFQQKVSDLVKKLDEIIAIIDTAAKKQILVIIDDIDKLDLRIIRDVFMNNINALFEPNCQIIYTLPISGIHDKDILPILQSKVSNRILQMRVLKLFVKGDSRQIPAQPFPKTKEILLDILGKRIDLSLFDDVVVDDLIIHSGGVLRELIRLVQQCCWLALGKIRRAPEDTDFSNYQISTDVLTEAINRLRLQISRPLGKVDWQILGQVYQDYAPDDPRDAEFLGLLKGLQVVEYRNTEEWHDVHPLLWEAVAKRQQT